MMYKRPGEKSVPGKKVFLSETTEDLEKIIKRNEKMKTKKFQDESESDEDIQGPEWLEQGNDHNININIEAFENPILKAHAEIIKKTYDAASAKDFSHIRNCGRYLPQSQFFKGEDVLARNLDVNYEVSP